MNKNVINMCKFGIVVFAGRVIIVVSILNIVAKVETVTLKRIVRFRG